MLIVGLQSRKKGTSTRLRTMGRLTVNRIVGRTMSPYLRYRTSDAQIRHFRLDDMRIDHRSFQVFPVPSHIIEPVLFPYATVIGEAVMQILLYIQPGKDALHIYTQTVIGTHPEICPYTDVIIEGISLGIHFLGHFITRSLDGTGKRRIDHIVLISDIII